MSSYQNLDTKEHGYIGSDGNQRYLCILHADKLKDDPYNLNIIADRKICYKSTDQILLCYKEDASISGNVKFIFTVTRILTVNQTILSYVKADLSDIDCYLSIVESYIKSQYPRNTDLYLFMKLSLLLYLPKDELYRKKKKIESKSDNDMRDTMPFCYNGVGTHINGSILTQVEDVFQLPQKYKKIPLKTLGKQFSKTHEMYMCIL